MFAKVFGGPLVRLIEHDGSQLVFRCKKQLKPGSSTPLKVSGQLGKPAKINAEILACRKLDAGDYVCTGLVKDLSHQRELGRLGAYSVCSEEGMRKEPRHPRTLPIRIGDREANSVDISSGGLQIESEEQLTKDEVERIVLNSELSCEARVAWINGKRAGLEFWEVDDATKILLSRFASGRAVSSPIKPKPPASSGGGSALSKLQAMSGPDYDSFE